jgi:hypothetical protein
MPVKDTVKEQVGLLKDGAKYQAVKLHVKKNKKFYMGFGSGVLVTLIVRRPAIHVSTTVQLAKLP